MELDAENTAITPDIIARTSQDVTTIAVTLPSILIIEQGKPAQPEMQFETREAVQEAAAATRRQLHARIIPVSVNGDGTIHVNEKAMLPEREYSIRVGDDTYQFVKRADGVVVMYELT